MLAAFLGLFSCTEEPIELQTTQITDEPSGDDLASLVTRTYQLSTVDGVSSESLIATFLMGFDQSEHDFEIRSYDSLLMGYAYDMISGDYLRYDLARLSTGRDSSTVAVGDYLIVAVIDDRNDARYSFTEVSLETDDIVSISKVFAEDGEPGTYEPWVSK